LTAAFLACLGLSNARAAELLRLDWNVGLDGQAGWLKYLGGDAPAGGFFAVMGAGVTTAVGTVSNFSLPPGSYRVWVKCIDYDIHGNLAVTVGGASVSALTDDRNPDKYWTSLGIVNVASTATSLQIRYTKPNAATPLQRLMLRGIYLTSDVNGVLTSDDFFGTFRAPLPSEVDNSTPVKGNLLPNSSFELGTGGGWGLNTLGRDYSLEEVHCKTNGYNSDSSIRFVIDPKESPPMLLSKPIRLRPNKLHTLSAYVRSSSACSVALNLICVSAVPPTLTPRVLKGGGIVAGPVWTRISLTDIASGYPDAEYEVQIVGRPSANLLSQLFIDSFNWKRAISLITPPWRRWKWVWTRRRPAMC